MKIKKYIIIYAVCVVCCLFVSDVLYAEDTIPKNKNGDCISGLSDVSELLAPTDNRNYDEALALLESKENLHSCELYQAYMIEALLGARGDDSIVRELILNYLKLYPYSDMMSRAEFRLFRQAVYHGEINVENRYALGPEFSYYERRPLVTGYIRAGGSYAIPYWYNRFNASNYSIAGHALNSSEYKEKYIGRAGFNSAIGICYHFHKQFQLSGEFEISNIGYARTITNPNMFSGDLKLNESFTAFRFPLLLTFNTPLDRKIVANISTGIFYNTILFSSHSLFIGERALYTAYSSTGYQTHGVGLSAGCSITYSGETYGFIWGIRYNVQLTPVYKPGVTINEDKGGVYYYNYYASERPLKLSDFTFSMGYTLRIFDLVRHNDE